MSEQEPETEPTAADPGDEHPDTHAGELVTDPLGLQVDEFADEPSDDPEALDTEQEEE